MQINYCVWDFNGTILDDVDAGIRSVNLLLRDRGLPEIPNKKAYQDLFGFPIIRYYERLGFDFSVEPYEVVAPLWVEQYLIHVQESRAFFDVKDTLEFFREKGIRQVVLSATERGMLEDQLTTLGLRSYFDEVLGLDNIHAASKLSLAEDFRARHAGARIIFLGDTDHDVESARVMDAECFLIARGHQSPERLKNLGVPLFSNLSEMRSYLINI